MSRVINSSRIIRTERFINDSIDLIEYSYPSKTKFLLSYYKMIPLIAYPLAPHPLDLSSPIRQLELHFVSN